MSLLFKPLLLLILFLISFTATTTTSSLTVRRRGPTLDHAQSSPSSLTYLWPLPADFTSGDDALSVDPALTLAVAGNGGASVIIAAAFERYREIVFKHTGSGFGFAIVRKLRERLVSVSSYDVVTLNITVHSDNEEVRELLNRAFSFFSLVFGFDF